MNTVILIYGILLIVLGIIGYLQSGSPTSFIGTGAGGTSNSGWIPLPNTRLGKMALFRLSRCYPSWLGHALAKRFCQAQFRRSHSR
ncbi:MAG: TMEM14 family protein [Chloroherpetonaceae bacterium]|nr:TMEM14 family protein [Chloroherpetonaceae bacterium]